MRHLWLAALLGLAACPGRPTPGTPGDDVTGDDVTGDDDVMGDDDDATGDDDDDDAPVDLAAEHERARRLAYANCVMTMDALPSYRFTYDADGWPVAEGDDADSHAFDRTWTWVREGGRVVEGTAILQRHDASKACVGTVLDEEDRTTYDAGERLQSRTLVQVDDCGVETTQTWSYAYDFVDGVLVEGRVTSGEGDTDVITYDDCAVPTRYAPADGDPIDYVNTYADGCILAEQEIVDLGTFTYEDGRLVRIEFHFGDEVSVTTYDYDCGTQ